MESIYRQYLGAAFDRLHPKMQERFGLTADGGRYMIGRGVMERIRKAGPYVLPFLWLGTARHIMFPETGRDIPFTIENFSYFDTFGRETVTWIRRFRFPKKIRCFDATMIYSPRQGRIIDYLGTRQHLAVDIDMQVNADGSVTIRSGAQRFYEGKVAFPFPAAFSGNAEVHESYDEAQDIFRIRVTVRNKIFGDVFGYQGWFKAEFLPVPAEGIPAYVKPLREERRE